MKAFGFATALVCVQLCMLCGTTRAKITCLKCASSDCHYDVSTVAQATLSGWTEGPPGEQCPPADYICNILGDEHSTTCPTTGTGDVTCLCDLGTDVSGHGLGGANEDNNGQPQPTAATSGASTIAPKAGINDDVPMTASSSAYFGDEVVVLATTVISLTLCYLQTLMRS